MRKRKKLRLQQEAEEMLQEESSSSSYSDEEEIFSGLYVFGEVVERTKRTLPNTTTEVVTYTVQDNEGRRYFVDEYLQPSDQEHCHERGAYVEIPVFVKTFKKKETAISGIPSVFNKKVVHIPEEFRFNNVHIRPFT